VTFTARSNRKSDCVSKEKRKSHELNGGDVEMQDTTPKKSQPADNVDSSGRRWEDVAKRIINEADSEKINALVQELCDMLDKTRKGPGSVRLPDISAESNRKVSR
jgi:hypothetical protein